MHFSFPEDQYKSCEMLLRNMFYLLGLDGDSITSVRWRELNMRQREGALPDRWTRFTRILVQVNNRRNRGKIQEAK